MAYAKDDVSHPPTGGFTPEREALLTPRDFEVQFKHLITPPSSTMRGLNTTPEMHVGERAEFSPIVSSVDRSAGRPISRIQLAREGLRRSVAWDISKDGVSRVKEVITHPDRSLARLVGRCMAAMTLYCSHLRRGGRGGTGQPRQERLAGTSGRGASPPAEPRPRIVLATSRRCRE